MHYICTAVCCDDLYIETLIHKLRNCLLTFRVFRDDRSNEANPPPPHINQGGKTRVGLRILDFGDIEFAFPFYSVQIVG